MRSHNEILLISSGVGGVLLLASVTGSILHRRVRETSAMAAIDNFKARVRSWWGMAFVLAGAFLAGDAALIALFAMISFAALREFLTLTAVRAVDRPALLTSFLILPAQYLMVGISRFDMFALFIPIAGLLAIPVIGALSGDTKAFLARTAEQLWGLIVCVYCISHVPALLMLQIPGHEGRGPLLMVFFVVIAQAGDVLQYVWGKLLGRHKIAPEVSPSKTVEGLIGGVVSVSALGAGLWWITPFSSWQAGAMAFAIALAGFLGGLVMSAIKRDRGVKDWSQLIKGHGGMLDRVDSMCFSAPIFFHLTRCLFAVS